MHGTPVINAHVDAIKAIPFKSLVKYVASSFSFYLLPSKTLRTPPSKGRKRKFWAPVLEGALAASITEGVFIDTAYYIYAGRFANGNVGRPRAVFASSAVMRDASSYFTSRKYRSACHCRCRSLLHMRAHPADDGSTELSGGFSVNQKISMSADNYGYESDSDLEDIESEDQHDDSKTTPLESDRDTEQRVSQEVDTSQAHST